LVIIIIIIILIILIIINIIIIIIIIIKTNRCEGYLEYLLERGFTLLAHSMYL
jgi:hypothetical protein